MPYVHCTAPWIFLAWHAHRKAGESYVANAPSPPPPCDSRVQSQQICLSVYNTALLGLVNLVITLFLADSAVLGQGGSAFTLIGGTVFAVSVLFAPKVYKVTQPTFPTTIILRMYQVVHKTGQRWSNIS